MERLASPFHLLAMFGFSMLGAVMVTAIMLASRGHFWGFSEREIAAIDHLPLSATYFCVGLGGFCLCFPFFLALYCTRYFLSEIERLEQKIASSSQAADSGESPKPGSLE